MSYARLMNCMLSLCLGLALTTAALPAMAKPFYYGRVTSLDSIRWWIETPGGPKGFGTFLIPPGGVDSIKGRKGTYKIRFAAAKVSPEQIAAWLPQLCEPMGTTVKSVTFKKKSKRWINADVVCG